MKLEEKAYDYLKENILNGKFKPDEIYSETKLSKELGISRTPFRSALIRLSHDRYIDIIPSTGFKLHKLSSEDIWNTYQIRMAIEVFCTMDLASNKNSHDGVSTRIKLKRTIADMKEAIEQEKDIETILNHDMEFHRILVSSSNNPELIKMFNQFYYRLFTTAKESLSMPGRPQKALKEHQAIFDAIENAESRQDLNVYRAITKHIEVSRDLGLEVNEN